MVATSFSSVVVVLSSSSEITDYEDRTVFSNYEPKGDHISMMYTFKKLIMEKMSIGDTFYDTMIMDGAPCGGNPGEPSLPVKGAYILVPQGTTVENIMVTPGEKLFLESDFMVEPVGEPVPLSQNSSAPLPTPNRVIYSSGDLFPGELFTIVGTHDFRGYEILVLALHPVQYLPFTGELYYYKDMKITIETIEKDGINPLFRGLKEDEAEVMRKVDNPDAVDTYSTGTMRSFSSDDDYDLLILTTDELKDGFEPLKNTHNAEGVNTTIKTLTDIGDNDPEDIRRYIRDAYLNWSIDYVLIGGDDDVVPAKDLFVITIGEPGHIEYNMPSDIYYACLDGSFNSDGDDQWGEPNDGDGGGDVDLVAEVYVGRACVGNTSEVAHFVNKTIAYLNTDDEYLRDVLWVGEYLGFYGVADFGGNYKDEMIDGSRNHGYITTGVPTGEDGYNISTLYDRDWPTFDIENPWRTGWPQYEIINRLTNGIHFLNHVGHSNYNANMGMITNTVDALTNDEYCFIYSWGCRAGGFDNPEGYDCIAEHFTVKTERGAFAGIWNARFGWGVFHSTDGPSQRYDREFWDAIFGENIREIGKANQDSKEDNLYRINWRSMRWCYYELNLFGDPTIALKSPLRNNMGVQPLDAPDHVKSNEIIDVNTTIFNSGRNDETDVLVSLLINGSQVNATTVPFFESQSAQHISFPWTPPEPNVYTITVNVTVPDVTEDFYGDNEQTETVIVGVQNVDTEECFETIQEALDDPDTLDGHTIIVPAGIFHEHVMINKGISLKGRNRDTTIIEGIGSAPSVIHILDTSFTTVSGFTIRNGTHGVYVQSSEHVIIKDNDIHDNTDTGLTIDATSRYNLIYYNTFNNNLNAVDDGYGNKWDNGYYDEFQLCGGNWWFDYNGSDELRGPDQNISGSDGIGDTPYNVSGGSNSQDNYPLMEPWTEPLGTVFVDDDRPRDWYDAAHVKTIQEGINNASADETVFVYNGAYYETVVVNKAINLIGEDKNNTTINGGADDESEFGVSVFANGVNIRGFTIKNGGIYGIGIYIAQGSNNIFDNTITNNDLYGIYIRSNYNSISGNTITNNGAGITLSHSGNTISGNNISSNDNHGIYISGSSNTIMGNTITNNDDVGILMREANGNTIVGNTIVDNGYGSGSHLSGIYLKRSSNSNIISANTIKNNNYGIYLKGQSNNNHIYHNNFINNQEDNAIDKCTNIWTDSYPSGGNHWFDYGGSDVFSGPEQNESGADGIGDTPYDIYDSDGVISNQDRYPLMEPYQPLPDLIIIDFSATQISETKMQLTAIVKNNGTADVTIPFQVSFYGYNRTIMELTSEAVMISLLQNPRSFQESRSVEYVPIDGDINWIQIINIGSIEISQLRISETAEATITWDVQPGTYALSASADSTRVIQESNERNNWTFISLL